MEETLKFIKGANNAEIRQILKAAAVQKQLIARPLPDDWLAELVEVSDDAGGLWLGYYDKRVSNLVWKLKCGAFITVLDCWMGGKHWSARRCIIKNGKEIFLDLEIDEHTKYSYRGPRKLTELFQMFRGRALTPADYEDFIETLEILGIADVEDNYDYFLAGIDKDELGWYWDPHPDDKEEED